MVYELNIVIRKTKGGAINELFVVINNVIPDADYGV